jgi:hypothetical protein
MTEAANTNKMLKIGEEWANLKPYCFIFDSFSERIELKAISKPTPFPVRCPTLFC